MLARQAFRAAAAAPLRQSFRTYATEAAASASSPAAAPTPTPAPKSSSNATAWIAGAAAAGATYAGYSWYRGTAAPPSKEELKGLAGKAAGKAEEAAPPPKAFLGGDQGFVDLKLASIEDFNHNTKIFHFDLPEKEHVSGLQIASALLTKFKAPDQEKPVIRPYTPISDEGDRGFLTLMIKKYPNGPMSSHIHSLKPGDTLSFKGPIPKYPWTSNKHTHVAMICGGTGITPMYQLLRAIFNNPEDKTRVSLVFGNLTAEDLLLKRELEKLEAEHPDRFRAFLMLDKPPKDWKHGSGHVTKDLLKTALPAPSDENIKVFVCGPPGMYKAVSGEKKSPADQGELAGMLKELGYEKDQVFKF